MKKISFLIALILILGFASQSFASYYYNIIEVSILNKHHYAMYYTGDFKREFSVKHKLSYSMAKKMLEHPNREYPIKYERILASYMYWSGYSYSFWLKKAEIQNFFENVVPHLKITNKATSYGLSYTPNMFSYFMKLIKDNKNFHNYYVKYLPLFPLVRLREKELLAAKREKVLSVIAKEKALLGNNRYKAIAIMNNYCSRHGGCTYKGYENDQNGYYTYYEESFVVAGIPVSGSSFMITQSLFSTQLQNQLVFMLKQNGYSNASTMNLTTAFVSYITPPGKRVLVRIQGLTDMVSSGNLKDFNELVNLFVKHFIKINK